ncbi:hypothetical protein MAL1_00057 [Bacteriophage DSS3_MAL1]|nr:hypothetical protein MAL1_00057 [Bacteriophage DSS3_MAL1]
MNAHVPVTAPEAVTLLHISFQRSRIAVGASNTHIQYTMRKKTPVGLLEATRTINVTAFHEAGPEVMDGRMFDVLSSALNREEMERLVEGGANSNFGTVAA